MRPQAHARCRAKHTEFQPSLEEWFCPKCGASPDGGFIVETFSDDIGSHEECEALHTQDRLDCGKCGYSGSGTAFAKAVAKKANLVPCPHCKGHGFVKGPA